MGCGASNHQPPSPTAAPVFTDIDNDDWMFYAPRYAHHRSRPDRPMTSSYPSSRCTDCADNSQGYTSTSSYSDSSDGRPHAPQSPSRYLNLGTRGSSSYSSRSYTPRSTPTHSRPGQASPRASTPHSTPAHSIRGETQTMSCRPILGPASSATYTSRSYSLLSTPTFHSPSSHPKNDLTLDPTLFSNNLSPFADGECANKIDTDCASRFSGSSQSSLSAFTSPTSSTRDARYPLTPLSVCTEPFPRV